MDTYEKKYKNALEWARQVMNGETGFIRKEVEEVFPELKESEDERIRKTLIEYFNAYPKDYYAELKKSHILAWLEKQGEKPQGKTYIFEGKSVLEAINKEKVEPKFKVGDRVNKNDREDEEHCILTITSVNIDEHCYICNQCSVIDFGEQDLWHIVEQKPAWSEDDEIGLSDALWAIKQASTIAKDENDMGNLWYAERWLKSLKERYTWKPSDEQMDNLSRAFNGATYRTSLLRELYTDLKKLREE